MFFHSFSNAILIKLLQIDKIFSGIANFTQYMLYENVIQEEFNSILYFF